MPDPGLTLSASGGVAEAEVRATAMRLFTWSITYITLLFGAMAVDQLLRSGW
jgi:protoheme IX farnesyltransferase